jgi:membrane protease YdiL (CAAX protease family)
VIGPILLAISWLLLRFEGRGLANLGFDQPRRRAREFALGFLFLGAASAIQQLGLSLAADDPFVHNLTVPPAAVFGNLRFTVNSALYEELVFRGYLLYQAIKLLGAKRAVLLDAAAFGIYHWFSYGIFGNPILMVYVLLLTGAFGLLWARAFVATGSVLVPIGLHLGWNAVAYILFSGGPLRAGLFVPASGVLPIQVSGWASLVLNVLLPLAVVAVGLWYCRRVESRILPPAVDTAPHAQAG